MNKIACISLSSEGAKICETICKSSAADFYLHSSATANLKPIAHFERVADLTSEIFGKYEGLIYVMPTGVVVRSIAPLLVNKYQDPAVVVLDVLGRWAISLLSGHEGGANDLAYRVANLVGAEEVVTTTTEAEKSIIAGIGCRRGVRREQVLEAFALALERSGIAQNAVRHIATAGLKQNEYGLLQAAQSLGVPLRIIPDSDIMEYGGGFERSEFVEKKTGLPAVAEPCALLGGRRCRLILKRIALNGVTVALAEECCGL